MLDAGCGYGTFLKFCGDIDYTGVDTNEARILGAKEKYGETTTRRFIRADIAETRLPDKSFDKAICYGLLHHLPDDRAHLCLKELHRLVRKSVVFSDPVYTKYHVVNNFFCSLDRGRYVRNAETYSSLCQPYFRNLSTRTFYARNGLLKYFLQVGQLS